jgi:hypothetical protein
VAVIAADEMRARRLADALRHLGGHRRVVGPPPDPVGSEKFTRHPMLVPFLLAVLRPSMKKPR